MNGKTDILRRFTRLVFVVLEPDGLWTLMILQSEKVAHTILSAVVLMGAGTGTGLAKAKPKVAHTSSDPSDMADLHRAYVWSAIWACPRI